MPIEVNAEIRIFSEDEFHALAYQIMGVVFEVHNDLGRLFDESVYQEAIRRRCVAAGIGPVRKEVEINVSHLDFEQSYFMDLLFAGGLMVETKTVEALNDVHHAQALHYLLLTGMQHGLLINCRCGEVDKRYVSTTLNGKQRRRFSIEDTSWQPINDASRRLRKLFLVLLADWGAFLNTSLYRSAVVHFFGGERVALRRIPIFDGNAVLGSQPVCLIADDTAFALTALKHGVGAMKDHLKRLLNHTRLGCIQWINMNNHLIEFRTLLK